MSQVLDPPLSAEDENPLEREIDACIAEIDRSHQRMELYQVEINSLREETRAILDSINARLGKMR